MSDIELDMRTRWTPSPQQDAQAARALRELGDASDLYVFTVHILFNKRRGLWNTGVEVVPLPHVGVLYSRDEALVAVESALDRYQVRNPGVNMSAGWTLHYPAEPGRTRRTPGRSWLTSWAVFEA